jgi:hypothetical protein
MDHWQRATGRRVMADAKDRNLRPDPQTAHRRRRQSIQRHQIRYREGKILVGCRCATERSGLEVVEYGALWFSYLMHLDRSGLDWVFDGIGGARGLGRAAYRA